MAVKSLSFLKRRIYVKHSLLTSVVAGKNVVHYGCVDDEEDLIKHKFDTGRYLHTEVTKSSKSTIGIDLNKQAFGFLKKKLGIDNIVYGDVEDPRTFEINKKAFDKTDILLIPDLIEHLNNPGNMLQGIKDYFPAKVKIVILTPNPVAWYNFLATLLGKEIYTPYHTMYYTTESLEILLNRYGYKITKILPVTSPKQRGGILRSFDSIVGKIAMFISPGFADLFYYECVLDNRAPKKK